MAAARGSRCARRRTGRRPGLADRRRQQAIGGSVPHRTSLLRVSAAGGFGIAPRRRGMSGQTVCRHPVLSAVHGPSFPAAARRWHLDRSDGESLHPANRVQRRARESRYLHTQAACQQKLQRRPRFYACIALMRSPRGVWQRGCVPRRGGRRRVSCHTAETKTAAGGAGGRGKRERRGALAAAAMRALQRAEIGGTGRCSTPV